MKEKWYAVAGNWEKITGDRVETKLHTIIYDDVVNENEALGKYINEAIKKLGVATGLKLSTWQVTTFLVPKELTVPATDWDEFCGLIGMPADSQQYNLSHVDFISVLNKYAAQHTAALREELEAVKKERDWLKEQFNLLRDKYSRIVPERDGLKSANVGLQEVLHNTLSDRNEAVNLLESASDIVKKCNYPGACYSVPAILKALFDNNVNSFISRLSSGETKPASPEILFYLLDNENPPYPEEDVLWYRKGEPPYAGSMLDENFPGLAYFYAFCNIPTPPDFLTDKK